VEKHLGRQLLGRQLKDNIKINLKNMFTNVNWTKMAQNIFKGQIVVINVSKLRVILTD
jgi:hypothetical protein